jgi:hypothetical protein
MIEIDAILVCDLRLENFEWPVDDALGEPLQVDTFMAESLCNAGFGKLR